jgi:putative inorganic carbon (HCO3(-)) transporter
MTTAQARRLYWLLPLVLYAAFLWRSLYSIRTLALGVLDWLVPAVGLGLWIVLRWRRGETWPRTTADLPVLVWLAVKVLTAVLSTEVRRGLFAAWEILTSVLLLYLLVDAVRRGWSRLLWRALYLVGAVVCVIGAVEFLAWYLGWPLLSNFQQGWPAMGGLVHPFPPVLYRIGLALVNNTALSAFMALLIPPAISILLATRDREVRVGMALWLIAAGVIVLLSLSRGGFVALGVSLPLLLLGGVRDPRFRRKWSGFSTAKVRLMLTGALGVILILAVGAGVLLASRLAEHRSGDAVRMDLWRSASAMFMDHPLAGVGPGAYGIALRSYRDLAFARDHVTTAHNLYLNIAAEMGALGVLAAVWLILTLARRWWQRWRGEEPGTSQWWRMLGVGAALAGFAAQSMVDTFVESAILLTAAFFVAQILAYPIPKVRPEGRQGRLLWAAAFAILLLGSAGMAWEAWGHMRFSRSLALTQQGAVEEALAAAEAARAHDPGMSLYSCHAGYLYGLQAAQGEEQALQMALDRYRECMATTAVPEIADQLNATALLWQAGYRDEARAMTRALTGQMPLQPAAWLNNGWLAEQAGDRQEAVQSYRRVLARSPELAGSPFWTQGARADWWDEITQSEKPAGAVPWRWQALLAAGRFDEAAREVDAWLKAHPNDLVAQIGLAEALVGLQRPLEALSLLDRVLEQAPASAQGYLVRGEARLALEQYEAAEKDLRMALFLGQSPRMHLGLARLALAMGQEDRALQQYAQALRPQVLSQNTYVVLYRRMGWPVTLPQVVYLGYRQDAEVALEWGDLLEARGDAEAAARVYQAALNLDPFLEEVRQRLERLSEE